MKILHIFSNWKWTGPAEHALNIACTLSTLGHSVTFACGSPPDGVSESLIACAQKAGIVPVTRFTLNKHFNILNNTGDVFRLRSYIKKEKFDLIHTHLGNDHFLAGVASRLCSPRIPIVRTCYDGGGLQDTIKNRLCLSVMTDALITISEQARSRIIKKFFQPAKKVWKLHVPVDLSRFNNTIVKGNRALYRLSEDDIVGGIVARVQKHRRFEVLLEALVIVLREVPQLKFMIIGRGTHIEEIAMKPSMKMGIRPNIIFTGYKAEDYAETLACLNFKVFLVPGSDGSCRAVREAMALGIPVIAANRGMLPEIIENNREGLIIEDSPEHLVEAMMTMIENPGIRRQMGLNAMHKAQEEFDLVKQTKKVEAIYEEVLNRQT
ncbi:MAG: glycosyltransferase family 4 protein [Proteobacteria bacterium]|nr:glycosyltransferase family 4 protein [Pseudomonadota bacterium]